MSAQVIPGRAGATVGRAGGLLTEGPGTTGMWSPIGGLAPGAGPLASSQEEAGPPHGVLAAYQDEEGLGDWGQVGPLLLQEESRECCRRQGSVVLSSRLRAWSSICSWRWSFTFSMFPTTAVGPGHRWRAPGEVCVAGVNKKLGHVVLWAVGHSTRHCWE